MPGIVTPPFAFRTPDPTGVGQRLTVRTQGGDRWSRHADPQPHRQRAGPAGPPFPADAGAAS